MRTIFLLAIGIWMGKGICSTLAQNRARQRELTIRKQLERFILEHLPALSLKELQTQVDLILRERQE